MKNFSITGFFRGSIETIILKFQKVLFGPSLKYSNTPIINNVPCTTNDPIDEETQFKAVHSIVWWAVGDLNPRLPPCEDGTLPLS
jgi:hypothetical protein